MQRTKRSSVSENPRSPRQKFQFEMLKCSKFHSIHQIEALHFDAEKSFGECGHAGVKNSRWMRLQRLAHLRHPRLQMLAEKCHLVREVGHGHIVPGDQVAHDFEDIGHMVLGVGQALAFPDPKAAMSSPSLNSGFSFKKPLR